MPLEVERVPDRSRARRMSRRSFLIFAGSTSSLVLLAACQGAAPQAPPASTLEPFVARTREPISAAQPTAAPTAAPAAAQPGPQGKFTEAWNSSITPAFLDPQENPPQITPYNFQLALHDALVKHMPGKTFAPSLAESYDVAPDYKSATFRLRPGIKFHDGSPVTPDDVKFTFEQYRGASAKVLHDKVDRIDAPDDRTVKFFFKEPFLDFIMIYGSPASGAGWVVPKAYYEKVGPNGFKQAPIGAGPFRFVK
jgi:peptide/nickel transport system substrate-binding protein